jgi:hypothetical protein
VTYSSAIRPASTKTRSPRSTPSARKTLAKRSVSRLSSAYVSSPRRPACRGSAAQPSRPAVHRRGDRPPRGRCSTRRRAGRQGPLSPLPTRTARGPRRRRACSAQGLPLDADGWTRLHPSPGWRCHPVGKHSDRLRQSTDYPSTACRWQPARAPRPSTELVGITPTYILTAR